MGPNAFDDLLTSIQAEIGTLHSTIGTLKKDVKKHTAKVAKKGKSNKQAVAKLAQQQRNLDRAKATIVNLKSFFVTLMKDWSDVNNRIIGRVVWSPPITGLSPRLNPPVEDEDDDSNGYTKDVCVIKLDKNKFMPNFMGNAVDLGTEIDAAEFTCPFDPIPLYDVLSDEVPITTFKYPVDRLYRLKSILPVSKIGEPANKDIMGDHTRFVLKRGVETHTTVGCLKGFDSHQRYTSLYGKLDSVEAAVYPYGDNKHPASGGGGGGRIDCFGTGGDSGAVIVGAKNDVVAQLTGGTGSSKDSCSSDIIYGTPMEWLWNVVIKGEFPDAVLFSDTDEEEDEEEDLYYN